MSSRVEIIWSKPAVFDLTKSWALFNHTSVPWESPEILVISENFVGKVSFNIPLTKEVPNSGIPKVPISLFEKSYFIFNGFVEEKIFITFSSSIWSFKGSVFVKSWRLLIIVGTSWPNKSSFKITPCIIL